ncbi:hypothetical protein BH11MYX3_BH11MYX3_10250 [soil metagenome]
MRRTVLAIVLLTATARAGDDRMNLAIGAGVDAGRSPGWTVRFGQTIEMSSHEDGFIYGGIAGYDYWHAADGSGFSIPVGGYTGARVKRITTTLGGGVGLLALEKIGDDSGVGIVPYLGATLGFELDDAGRTVTIDGRFSRHVLGGARDVTRWSVVLMIGTSIGP